MVTFCVRMLLAASLLLPRAAGAQPPESWTPPQYVSGTLPETPKLVVGGGEVILDAILDTEGRVQEVAVVRATAPFTDAVVAAVRDWRFRAVEGSHVLVAYVARPPTLSGPTLGERPVEVGVPSPAVARPVALEAAEYPPNAFGDGVALVEIEVDASGRAAATRVVQSAGPFDAAALDAVRRWRFEPARIDGQPAATFVYAVFAWRPPVGTLAVRP